MTVDGHFWALEGQRKNCNILRHITNYCTGRAMSVRKRKWTTRSGEVKEVWIVDYTADGKRHIQTFKKKKDADATPSKRASIFGPVRIRRYPSRSPWRRRPRTGSRRSDWTAAKRRRWRRTVSTQPTSPSASAISSSRVSPHRASTTSATICWHL